MQSQSYTTGYVAQAGNHLGLVVRLSSPDVRVESVTDDGNHSWQQQWHGDGEELWVTQLRVSAIRVTVTLDKPAEADLRLSLIDRELLEK